MPHILQKRHLAVRKRPATPTLSLNSLTTLFQNALHLASSITFYTPTARRLGFRGNSSAVCGGVEGVGLSDSDVRFLGAVESSVSAACGSGVVFLCCGGWRRVVSTCQARLVQQNVVCCMLVCTNFGVMIVMPYLHPPILHPSVRVELRSAQFHHVVRPRKCPRT